MIAEVNAVLEGNQIILQNDPVRGLDDAIADVEKATSSPSSVGSDKVEAFLAGYTAKKGNKPVVSEPAPSAPAKVETNVKPQQQSQLQSQTPSKVPLCEKNIS